MKFEKEETDIRGFRYIYLDNKKIITLFQIKKGFVRGGQYHQDDTQEFLIAGKVEYHKENIFTKEETVEILDAPCITILPKNNSDLIIALADSILVGVYPKDKITFYDKHKKIVLPYRKIR